MGFYQSCSTGFFPWLCRVWSCAGCFVHLGLVSHIAGYHGDGAPFSDRSISFCLVLWSQAEILLTTNHLPNLCLLIKRHTCAFTPITSL